MSWLVDLAAKAENVLNKLDETTATALNSNDNEPNSSLPKDVER